jgi:hypothetical protein
LGDITSVDLDSVSLDEQVFAHLVALVTYDGTEPVFSPIAR